MAATLHNLAQLLVADPPSRDLLRDMYRRLDSYAAWDAAFHRADLSRAGMYALTLRDVYPPSALLLRCAN